MQQLVITPKPEEAYDNPRIHVILPTYLIAPNTCLSSNHVYFKEKMFDELRIIRNVVKKRIIQQRHMATYEEAPPPVVFFNP